jgi:alanine dehydrogenase
MLIGVPRETKIHEYRVGMVPAHVATLVAHGHQVLVERNAGAGISAGNDDYAAAGAAIADSAQAVFAAADLIVKVKEPQAAERCLLRPRQLLFTYLHLAADPAQAADLIASGATCIAYETVSADDGSLPLLTPMSAVAGRLSVQAGAYYLEKSHGGTGILLGSVHDVAPAKVLVLGGGVVGSHAIEVALGMGAHVCVIDHNPAALDRLRKRFGPALATAGSGAGTIMQHCTAADLVIGGVLVAGATAPKVVTRDMVRRMRPGSVIVDVAIDQGGCCETSRPTTHESPVYLVDGVIHYCVVNMPGAVPRTSTYALNNVTMPFILALADHGLQALESDPHLRNGLTVHGGKITNRAVAKALGYAYVAPEQALLPD